MNDRQRRLRILEDAATRNAGRFAHDLTGLPDSAVEDLQAVLQAHGRPLRVDLLKDATLEALMDLEPRP